MRRRRRAALVGVALLISSCATSGHWSGVAEREWIELHDSNLVFTTDLPRDTALERFRALQELRAALVDHIALVLPARTLQLEPFAIVHLASCSDFRRVTSGIAGYVTTSADASSRRLMVTCDTSPGRDETFVHELTHVVTAAPLRGAPTWLREGLAMYYQTLRIEDDDVIIGTPIAQVGYAREGRFVGGTPLDELLAMPDEEFHDRSSMSANYLGAWMLVHLLNSPPNRAAFLVYLRMLGAGRDRSEAWSLTFGKTDLGRQHAAYVERMTYEVYRGRLRPFHAELPQPRRLRAGEVHAVWLNVQMTGDASPDEIAAQAAALGRDDPDWVERPFWEALALRRKPGGARGAERLLRAYVARAPRDERAWTALVQLGLDRLVRDDHVGIGGDVPDGLASLDRDVMSLVGASSGSHALNLIGWYYALVRRPKVGLAFAYRALRAEPACGACHDTLALLLFHDGRPAEALAAQERAIALMGDRGVPADAKQRLEIYRRAAAKPPGP